MSIDAGCLAPMTSFNNTNPAAFSSAGLSLPTSGFGTRNSRLNTKRLSVALPPKVSPISENQTDHPTPRTSRGHLLAGLRTAPKTASTPASATHHQSISQPANSILPPQWADSNRIGYNNPAPQTATGASFDMPAQYGLGAGRQVYALPEQVLAPPAVYDSIEDVDPNVLQTMQMQHMFLAQRQLQLQLQLANITAAAQGLNMNGNMQQQQQQHASLHQNSLHPQLPFNCYGDQPPVQTPMEVPGQPGVYLVYNQATQAYTYAFDPTYQPNQQFLSLVPQPQANVSLMANLESPAPNIHPSPPMTGRSTPLNSRSSTPPKQAPSPLSVEQVEPLPPPSANAFRRTHKKSFSLAINAFSSATDGPKTTSAATFGSQRSAFPPTPTTGSFGPGAARVGEHPTRQPRGPPPLEELTSAPTSKHDGSKNFATRQRRRALESLLKAGSARRAVSRSSGGSPVSERELHFSNNHEDVEDTRSSGGSRKMSPIGSEMKEKRGSPGSDGGYFGLSSSSSSEGEDGGLFKNPPTPAAPGAPAGNRKSMMCGVLNAAEKRRSYAI